MRYLSCDACSESHPTGELFRVADRTLCEKCGNALLAEGKVVLKQGDIERHVDPTVCGWCATDHGEVELGPIVGVPTCPPCEARMRNWPFPLWVKIFFAALLCISVAAFAYNFRFFKSAIYLKRAARTADVDKAREWIIAASDLVPESKPLKVQADLCRAVDFMVAGEEAKAVPLLRHVAVLMPEDQRITVLLLQAESGVAFDNKDYDKFLRKAEQIAEATTGQPIGPQMLASAYACKYAVTRNETFKQKALENLAVAERQGAANEPDFAEFKNRMEFRLATREILDHDEFKRRFPDGWKDGANQ